MNGRTGEAIIEHLYPELERRSAIVKPDGIASFDRALN